MICFAGPQHQIVTTEVLNKGSLLMEFTNTNMYHKMPVIINTLNNLFSTIDKYYHNYTKRKQFINWIFLPIFSILY